MKNQRKIALVLCVVLILAVGVFGCSGQGGAPGGKAKIQMKDIDWTVEESIVDGKRTVVFGYTNNTPFSILNLEMAFVGRDDLTEEEKAAFYNDLKTEFGITDEEAEELKEVPISANANVDRMTRSGESATDGDVHYFSGYVYLRNMEHMNLMKPDIATVQYVDNERIYTAYYDFNNKKLKVEEETEPAYEWSETDLGNHIPKPEVEVVSRSYDYERSFGFDAYGMTRDQFDAYVDECKAMGYTVDPSQYDGHYAADNSEGYSIYLSYTEKDLSLYASLDAPDT